MKAFLLAAILVTLVGASRGEDAVALIKQEAENCAKAVLTGDDDGVVRYTVPRIIKLMGGKEAVISALKKGMAQMRAQGFDFGEVSVGQPEAPKKIGEWLVSMVPQRVVMKAPGGKLYKDSDLLAISEDAGKHWVFMDLASITQETFGKLFPELADKVTIPEPKKTVFKADKG